jgi:hypothetical protein
MEQTRPFSELPSPTRRAAPAAARPAAAPGLALVQSRLRLALPEQDAPAAWHEGLSGLLDWLGIDAEFDSPRRARRLPRLGEWTLAPAAGAPVFAPWLGWSPVAFQHGGLPGLPPAQFVASYLVDHARGAAPGQAGADVVLMSPHPATCTIAEAGGVPVPRPAVLRAMIRSARSEGRERLAIILHARQRNAVATMLLAAGKALTREGLAIEILTIEEALAPLAAPRAPWDAIIAMPDVRGTVFTLLARSAGVRGAWPMLWLTGTGETRARGGLRLITSEAPGEGVSRLPLDAPALIHALALMLHAGGAGRAAWRLHEAWARLRDSGVTTPGRGGEDAPYVSVVEDAAFLAMIGRGAAVSKRPQAPWRALDDGRVAFSGTQTAPLRVVS